MACADEAHAETVAKLGPRKPYLMEMTPPGILTIILVMRKGLKRGVPSPSVKNSFISLKKWVTPPMPEVSMTPTSSKSVFSEVMPESAMASSAATMSNWANKSYLRTVFLSKKSSGL